jgi:hypothetical protein
MSDVKHRHLQHRASIIEDFTDTTSAPSTPMSSIDDITFASYTMSAPPPRH